MERLTYQYHCASDYKISSSPLSYTDKNKEILIFAEQVNPLQRYHGLPYLPGKKKEMAIIAQAAAMLVLAVMASHKGITITTVIVVADRFAAGLWLLVDAIYLPCDSLCNCPPLCLQKNIEVVEMTLQFAPYRFFR